MRCTVPHPPPRTGQTIPPVTTSGTLHRPRRCRQQRFRAREHNEDDGQVAWICPMVCMWGPPAPLRGGNIAVGHSLPRGTFTFYEGPQHSPTLSVEAKQIAICSTKWCTRHTYIVLKMRRSSAVHPAAPVFAIHYSTLTLCARGSTHCVIPEKPQTTCAVRPCRATCATPGSDRPDRPPPRVDRQRHCRASLRIGTVARCRSTAQAPQATCGVCPP